MVVDVSKCCCRFNPDHVLPSIDSKHSYHYCKDYQIVPDGISSDIELLQISGNPIEEIQENSFATMRALQELFLDYNNLKVLRSGSFNNLTSIKTISITNNDNLDHIELGAFPALPSLIELNMGHNKLFTLDVGLFQRLTGLRSLYLNDNRFQTLGSGMLSGLNALDHLYLQDNFLSQIKPEMLSDVSNLHTLILASNEIETIVENSFTILHRLSYLSLQGNKLAVISANTFLGLSSLKTLVLAQNQISVIDRFGFSGLRSIHEINLRNNSLSTFSHMAFNQIDFTHSWGHVFQSDSSPGFINLTENSMQCNKNLCWMQVSEEEEDGEGQLISDDFACINNGQTWFQYRRAIVSDCSSSKTTSIDNYNEHH